MQSRQLEMEMDSKNMFYGSPYNLTIDWVGLLGKYGFYFLFIIPFHILEIISTFLRVRHENCLKIIKYSQVFS